MVIADSVDPKLTVCALDHFNILFIPKMLTDRAKLLLFNLPMAIRAQIKFPRVLRFIQHIGFADPALEASFAFVSELVPAELRNKALFQGRQTLKMSDHIAV